jgi:peptide/nickel transport system ATP-binding protein
MMTASLAPGTDAAEDRILLDIRNITVTAGKAGNSAALLRDVSLTLRRGKILGLVGESGAGKSMIGRLIGRQLPPSFRVAAGELLFEGIDLLKMSAADHRALLGRRIAFIPQEPMSALNPVLTIGDQLGEHLARQGVPASQRRAMAAAALDEVKIQAPVEVLDKYPFQLSGGMCQRVMIAMAFLSNPDLVISDEATTALDVTTQTHMIRLLRGLQERRGTTIIFITHDLRLAAHVCDDLAVLYAGDIFEQGDAKAILAAPRHPYTLALNGANPSLDGDLVRLASLAGQMPSAGELRRQAGCRLAPRCALAIETCSLAVPPLAPIAPAHAIRCIFIDTVRSLNSAVPIIDEKTPGPEAAAQPLLAVTGLSKSYAVRRGWGRKTQVPAVADVGFTIAPGEFLGIVGESGSGKSTIGRLIMGLETPDSGTVALNGAILSPSKEDWQKRIAEIQFVFQDPRSALNPRRKVLSLATQSWEAKPYLQTDRKRRAGELMADVGMSVEMVDRYPRQLSGGQRQRVNIARALCEMPRLLIADEIVSGLDVLVQAQILNLLLALRREHNISLLFISHDLAVVRYLCSRVLVMQRGKVVESGPTETVFRAPVHPYTRELLASVPPEDSRTKWPA